LAILDLDISPKTDWTNWRISLFIISKSSSTNNAPTLETNDMKNRLNFI